jgi:hypothetical protein
LRWDGERAAYFVNEPGIGNTDVYTADQMHAYAKSAADRAEVVEAENKGFRRIRVESAGLDPITVFDEDFGDGRGRLTITCYASAWTCWWGAMGRPLAEFVAKCHREYVASNMLTGRRTRVRDDEQKYVERVAQAVIDHFANELAALLPDGSTPADGDKT